MKYAKPVKSNYKNISYEDRLRPINYEFIEMGTIESNGQSIEASENPRLSRNLSPP